MKTTPENFIVSFTLPAYWASYLINGDDSGLEPEEIAVADSFLARHSDLRCVSCDEESHFAWSNDAMDLGGDVLEYDFLTA